MNGSTGDPSAESWGRRHSRESMVRQQLRARGICDERVLAAMGRVPRHRFVRERDEASAYADSPLPIGFGQTISQPYIVALMTELLAPRVGMAVLEIGTGCGYQTAILAALGLRVHSLEVVPALAEAARGRLASLGLDRGVSIVVGNGRLGLPQAGPFAGIVVTAAPEALVPAWGEQLEEGGRLVVPIGARHEQWLRRYTKSGGALRREDLMAVRFVPLIE